MAFTLLSPWAENGSVAVTIVSNGWPRACQWYAKSPERVCNRRLNLLPPSLPMQPDSGRSQAIVISATPSSVRPQAHRQIRNVDRPVRGWTIPAELADRCIQSNKLAAADAMASQPLAREMLQKSAGLGPNPRPPRLYHQKRADGGRLRSLCSREEKGRKEREGRRKGTDYQTPWPPQVEASDSASTVSDDIRAHSSLIVMQGNQGSKAVDGKARRRPTWDDDSFAAEEGKARAASRVISHLPGALDSRVRTICQGLGQCRCF